MNRNRAARDLVVCSLEPWDQIWRRNQFLVRELMELMPSLRVLFVEPAIDLLHPASRRRARSGHGLRPIADFDDRGWALGPTKVLPRLAGPWADRSLTRQLVGAARTLGFTRPVLWVNDAAYAGLVRQTSWPTLYDVTDDWLAAGSMTGRQLHRLRRWEGSLLAEADTVVVCSPALAASRGAVRDVVLIPNAVDVARFRSPAPRPADLPPGPTALYVGTLHRDRLDVDLCLELARRLPEVHLVLVGPVALDRLARRRLSEPPNLHVLGPRPYDDVPAYLQHAGVVVVPHVVTPFTDSLDPIKAYECLAIDPPVVATPVAGFRELSGDFSVVERDGFVDAVARLFQEPGPALVKRPPPTWRDRALEFESVLEEIAKRRHR